MLIASNQRFAGIRSSPTLRVGRGSTVPLLLLTTMAAFFLGLVFPGQLLGFNVSGWLWVGILIVAAALLVINPTRVAFPVVLWLPWVAYSVCRIQEWNLLGVQSTVQILLPVLVATSSSTVTFSGEFFGSLDKCLRYSFIILSTFFVTTALPWALSDNTNSGWITGGIIALFFQSYFLCSYLLRGYRRLDLICVLAAMSIPIVLTLRGPILGSMALCVLVLAPLSILRRGLIATLVVGLALAVFYSPRVQTKMFFTGQGSLTDLRKDNENLNTSGRSFMSAVLEQGLKDSVWIGHGANSAGQAVTAAGSSTPELHNDWLRIRYNSGRFGVMLFVATMVAQVGLLLRAARGAPVEGRLLLLSGVSCFIPFAIVMFTDNLLVYCQNFTIPHFLLIGYGYASTRESRELADLATPEDRHGIGVRPPPFRGKNPLARRYAGNRLASKFNLPAASDHR